MPELRQSLVGDAGAEGVGARYLNSGPRCTNRGWQRINLASGVRPNANAEGAAGAGRSTTAE